MTEEEYRSLPPGWSSKDSVDALEDLAKIGFDSVIEFGPFVGRSTRILARYSGRVHCVDTWNGRFVSDRALKIAGLNDKLEIYDSFLNNTSDLKNVSSTRMQFAPFMETHSDCVELIFIDAGPLTEIIDQLIEYAWNKSTRCIAGYHYYSDHRNIADSVDRFANKNGLTVQVDRCLWKIHKE